ncbi:MAG: flagellar hook-length control protein FliK [Lachnospira sp.]
MVSAAISGFTSAGVTKSSGVNVTSKDAGNGLDFTKIMTASLSDSAKNQNNQATSIAQNYQKTDKIEPKSDDSVKETSGTVKGNDSAGSSSKSDLNEPISEAVSEIKDKIKDELNVSDEEIANAMAVLSMTAADLFSVEKVTELIAQLNGNASTLDIITDENLLMSLNNVLDTVNKQLELLSEAGGVGTDEVVELVKESGFDAFLSDIVTDDAVQADAKKADASLNLQTDSADVTVDTDVSGDSLSGTISRKTVVTNDKQTGDFNQNSSSDSFAGKETEPKLDVSQFGNNLATSISDAIEQITTDVDMPVNGTEVLRQVIEQVKVMATEQLQSIEVILNPENLGTVHVTVSAKEGIVTAQLTATNEQVKAALENQIIQLKEHFNNQGIKVEAVEVTVHSHGFEAGDNMNDNSANQNSQGRKGFRRLDLSSLDDLDENDLSLDEIRARDSLVSGESSVVYRA